MDSQASHPGSTPPQNSLSDMILAMLTKLSDSNQALMQRIESIEQKQQMSMSQPSHVITGSTTHMQHPVERDNIWTTYDNIRNQGERLQPQDQPAGNTVHFPSLARGRPMSYHMGTDTRLGDPASGQIPTRTDIQSDGVIPTLYTLKRTPSISDTVAHLLESYEEQARASLQGRPSNKKVREIQYDRLNSHCHGILLAQ